MFHLYNDCFIFYLVLFVFAFAFHVFFLKRKRRRRIKTISSAAHEVKKKAHQQKRVHDD